MGSFGSCLFNPKIRQSGPTGDWGTSGVRAETQTIKCKQTLRCVVRYYVGL